MTDCLRKITIKSCNEGSRTNTADRKPRSEDPPGIPICDSSHPHKSLSIPLNDKTITNTEVFIPQLDEETREVASESVHILLDEETTNYTEVLVPQKQPCVTCVHNYTDFYCLGLIWMGVLKTALLGFDLGATVKKLMPVVEAKECKKDEKQPDKPGKMKYKDLPLYRAPHFEYKDYIERSQKCKGYDVKILHELLVPTVSSYRKSVQSIYKDVACGLCCTYKEVRTDVHCSFEEIKKYFRDSKRTELRQGIVVTSSVLAYLLARKKTLSRRIFYTGIGALASGFLCFPEATDEAVRTGLYHAGKMAVCAYSCMCKKVWNIRERVPCERDLPEVKKICTLKDKWEKK